MTKEPSFPDSTKAKQNKSINNARPSEGVEVGTWREHSLTRSVSVSQSPNSHLTFIEVHVWLWIANELICVGKQKRKGTFGNRKASTSSRSYSTLENTEEQDYIKNQLHGDSEPLPGAFQLSCWSLFISWLHLWKCLERTHSVSARLLSSSFAGDTDNRAEIHRHNIKISYLLWKTQNQWSLVNSRH